MAAQHSAGKGLPQRIQVENQAVVPQLLGHGLQPRSATRAEPAKRGEQARVIVAQEMAKQMDLAAVQLARQLGSSHELQAQPRGLRPGNCQG